MIAELAVGQPQHVVVVAAGVEAGPVVRGKRGAADRGQLRRQNAALHRAGAGELLLQPIAAAAHFALELLARDVVGDARDHFLGLDGLRDVVGGAELEAGDLVGHLAQRRQEDDDGIARGRVALQRAAHLEAVHLRHHHVEQDQIGMDAAGDVERGAAVLCREQTIAAPFERADDEPQIHRAVVDDENRRAEVRRRFRAGDGDGHEACWSSDAARRSSAS